MSLCLSFYSLLSFAAGTFLEQGVSRAEAALGCCALTSACPEHPGSSREQGSLGAAVQAHPIFQPWSVRGEQQPQLTLLPVPT